MTMNARCWTRFEPVPLTSDLNQTRVGSPPTSSLFFFSKDIAMSPSDKSASSAMHHSIR